VIGSTGIAVLLTVLTAPPGYAATAGFPTDGSWAVPAGVSVVRVSVTSGSGGDGGLVLGGGPALGGLALTATAHVSVSAGETIYVGLGDNGQDSTTGTATSAASAFNIGSGGAYTYSLTAGRGGGGGGASAIAVDDDIVLIAGGGGGAGGYVDMGLGAPTSGAGGNAGGNTASSGADASWGPIDWSSNVACGGPVPLMGSGGAPGDSITGTGQSTLSRTGSDGGGAGQDTRAGCNTDGGAGGAGYVGGSAGTGGGGDVDQSSGGGGGGGSSFASPSRIGGSWFVTAEARGSTPSGSIEYIDITTTALGDVTAGTPYTASLAATFGASDTPDQWTVSPALPSGLTLNSATGAISGTAAAASSGTFAFTASEVSGGSILAQSSVNLTLNVVSAPTPAPAPAPATGSSGSSPSPSVLAPQLTPEPPGAFTWVQGQESATRVVGNRGSSAVFTIQPALPAGLILDDDAGIIRGQPEEFHAESEFVVTATNAQGRSAATILLAVQGAGQPTEVALPTPSVRFAKRSMKLDGQSRAQLNTWLNEDHPGVTTLVGVLPRNASGASVARKRAVQVRRYLRARGASVSTTIRLTTAADTSMTRRVLLPRPA